MRKPVLLIWTNAAILVVLFALMAQSLFVVSRIARTKWAHGQVQVLRAGQNEWTSVVPGTPIKAGDTLLTGSDGRAEFAWADGTRWKLEPQTRLLVQRAVRNSRQGGEQTQFRLESGKVWVRLVKRLGTGSGFQIETPTALARAVGTVWSIEVAGDQTRVDVLRGFVDVSISGSNLSEVKRLLPSTQALVSASGIELQNASPGDQAAFEAQRDLTHPELSIDVKFNCSDATLSGQTEAGDTLTLNGQAVKVLGTGAFVQRVALNPGFNRWNVTSTDVHGETTSECRAAQFDGKTATMSACR